MSFARAKIDAQNILLTSRRKAIAICLLGFFLRLVCLLCTGVSLYSLLHLADYSIATQSVYAEIGFYTLFSVATLLSLWLTALLTFLQKRWFLENSRHAVGISVFFGKFRFGQAVKIGVLYSVKKVLAFLGFLFYLLPFFVFAAGFFYELQSAGMSQFLAVFSLVFLGVLCFVGLYFGFAAAQNYAFCDALLALSPQAGLIDTLKMSRKLARKSPFAVVRFKLRFFPWVLCSFLILPAFYALPYYRQSMACMTKSVLVKNHLTQEAQKPIVFLIRAQKPLQA